MWIVRLTPGAAAAPRLGKGLHKYLLAYVLRIARIKALLLRTYCYCYGGLPTKPNLRIKAMLREYSVPYDEIRKEW